MRTASERAMEPARIQRSRSYERLGYHEMRQLGEMGFRVPLDCEEAKRSMQSFNDVLTGREKAKQLDTLVGSSKAEKLKESKDLAGEDSGKNKKTKADNKRIQSRIESEGKPVTYTALGSAMEVDMIEDLTVAGCCGTAVEEVVDLSDELMQMAISLKQVEPGKIASTTEQKINDLRCNLAGFYPEHLAKKPMPVPWRIKHDLETEDDNAIASYRRNWESAWSGEFGRFEDTTPLSPMIFTRLTLDNVPEEAVHASSLHVYSIKVMEIKGDLRWPLYVHGVVAARDHVDRNRNLLFHRKQDDYQTLTEEDHSLLLTGPSRAIVFLNTVHFEIELKVKDTTKSQDRVLISRVLEYDGTSDGLVTHISNAFCTVELCFQQLDITVQATILSVEVVGESSQYGGRVVCRTDFAVREFVLLDSRDGTKASASSGYFDLSRRVVAVDLRGKLEIRVQAYLPCGQIGADSDYVVFTPKMCGISRQVSPFGTSKVEINVAWSFHVHDKRYVAC